ncbi:hypothetical protein RCL1_004308 [Eukaryota sp. TZLM3-RCL]
MWSYLVILLVATAAFADTSCCNDERCVYSTDSFNQEDVKHICGDDVHACRMTCDSLPDLPPVIGCVARSTIMSRAQHWVDLHIPYSQSKTYDGYRTDCSGFVSMSWLLSKPGATTRTLMNYAHSISKNNLQPGDALLNAGSHVVLFGGWANANKSEYYGLEESGSKGTVKRVIPYPYWSGYGTYSPIRLNNVC